MTDNIGEQMTDDELYAAQPAKDFEFNLEDTVPAQKRARKVVVPNWMAREGRWSEIWGALDAARQGNMATAAERMVNAMEFARQLGRKEEAAKCRATGDHNYDPPLTEDERLYRQLEDYRRGRTSTDIRSVRPQLSPKAREFPNKGDAG